MAKSRYCRDFRSVRERQRRPQQIKKFLCESPLLNKKITSDAHHGNDVADRRVVRSMWLLCHVWRELHYGTVVNMYGLRLLIIFVTFGIIYCWVSLARRSRRIEGTINCANDNCDKVRPQTFHRLLLRATEKYVDKWPQWP